MDTDGSEFESEQEPDIGDLVNELEDLESSIDDPETRAQLQEVTALATRIKSPVFGRVIRGFDRSDASEAYLGSLIFGVPMMVEGGTVEVGEFLAVHPVYLLGTYTLTLGIVWGILYVAEIQDVRIHDPLFGLLPRRFTGVIGIALISAIGLTTGWGRVSWGEPMVAIGTVAVAFLPMSIGGALGDILPGT